MLKCPKYHKHNFHGIRGLSRLDCYDTHPFDNRMCTLSGRLTYPICKEGILDEDAFIKNSNSQLAIMQMGQEGGHD